MKRIVWPTVSLAVAVADLLLKKKAEENNSEMDRKIAGGKILLRKVHNHGLAMNTLDEYPKVVKGTALAAMGTMAVVWMLALAEKGNILKKCGLSLILGGAVSNIYDRLKRGYVVDYIAFNVKKENIRNITFNLGDFAIFGGMFMLVGQLIKK